MKTDYQQSLFSEAFSALLLREGGYVNDPNDGGGETKYGISSRSYPDLDIKNLTQETAKAIYYKDFWLKYKCDQISDGDKDIAFKFFDMCVNMGGRQATLCLQRALRACGRTINDDGIIGPLTINAVITIGNFLKNEALAALRSESAGYYRLITALHPKNEKYIEGWLNRAYA